MKKLIFILLLLGSHSFFSQEEGPRELLKTDLDRIRQQTQLEADSLRIILARDAVDSYLDPEIDIQFQIDTFKVEQIFRKKLEIDYTTAGMLKATYEALAEYDLLLNKYYKLLLAKLSSRDAETLKKTQRNWITYRNSEIELINILGKDEYSGGGTIQSLIQASRIQNLTTSRVLELYDYIRLFVEE